MAKEKKKVNQKGLMVAPLTNVSLFSKLMEMVCDIHANTPGMAVFYGYSGYGKTMAAVYGANTYRAYYVECGESWNKTWLVKKIFVQIFGYEPKLNVPETVEQIIKSLAESKRPLIIDEADRLIKTSSSAMIDVVREIHDRSRVPVILIGEERMPSKLLEFERAHNRVLEWVPAQPCSFDDAGLLLDFYGYDYVIQDELLKAILEKTAGCTRRVVTNFERLKELSKTENLTRITAEDWPEEKIDTGFAKPRTNRRAGAV